MSVELDVGPRAQTQLRFDIQPNVDDCLDLLRSLILIQNFITNPVSKVPFQVPFSVAKIVTHMQGLHQTARFPQNKELVWMK